MRKIVLLMFATVLSISMTMAQVRTLSGRVIDEKGEPVPFASVIIKNTKAGTNADANGNFLLKVKAGDVLVVSSTGYTGKQITVGTEATEEVSLLKGTTELGVVTVTTALNIKRNPKEIGYATASINNATLTQAKVTDISTGLAAKVSGLQINLVNNSVDPSTRIVLRGNRSITGNNEALLVVDGVPIDDVDYINKIDPEDVENVSVLKGAVAAAIYGSKASNGVLIITTKHGSRNKPTITVGNTLDLETVSYLPKLQSTFGQYGGEGAYTNADGTTEPVPYENQSYGPAFDGRTIPSAIYPVSFNPDGTVAKFDTQYIKYSAVPNAKKDFFNTGLTNQFNASYSAGDDKGTFYLGVQDVNVNGVIPNDVSRRDNFRLNGSRDYGRFHAEYSLSYNQSTVNEAGNSYNQTTGGVFSGRPLYFEILNFPADIQITNYKDWQNNVLASPSGFFDAYATNPYWTISNSRQLTNTRDLLGNINLSYKAFNWLTISDRLGLTQSTEDFDYTRDGITFAPWAIADPWNAGNVPSSLKTLAPSVYNETFFEERINNDLIGAFDKSFGDFSIKGVLGFNLAQQYESIIDLEGDNLQFPGFFNISSVLGTPGYAQSSYKQRDYAYYEEATLGFKDYLFLHLSNRDEWNSVLDPSVDHYNYPGADLSFVFTQGINALKNNKFLSYGKIRGGATDVGNINLSGTPFGAYELQNYYVTAGGFPFGSLGGYSQSTTTLNPLIQPEKTTEYEGGVELGFLQNRINFQGTYYSSQTKNQSLTSVISAATGYTAKVVNAGQVNNQGVELDLNLTVVKTRNLTWNVGANYTHQSNKVVSLTPGTTSLELAPFYGAGVSGGIYAVQGSAYPVIETTDWYRDSLGRVIVDPKTGAPSVDPNNKIYGTTNPTDLLGINTSLTYKGLTFAAVLDYRGGNFIMNSNGQNLDFTGISYHSAENGRQSFIFPNSVVAGADGKYVPNTSVAVANAGNIGGAGFWPTVYTSGIGSVYVTSGAFWKLREASLTYQIPGKLLAKVKFIKKTTIGLVGRNLFMLRPKSNFWTDPEFADTTGNAIGSNSVYQLPPTRIYGANISFTF